MQKEIMYHFLAPLGQPKMMYKNFMRLRTLLVIVVRLDA